MVRERIPRCCCQVTKGIDTIRSGRWLIDCKLVDITLRPVDLPVFYLPQVRRLDHHYESFVVLELLFEVLATSSNFLLF